MMAVDEGRPAARTLGTLPGQVLTLAGIYGANASGKSNVLDALAWLATAVRHSFRVWDEEVPRDPFRFDGEADRTSCYEIEMMWQGVRHHYHLEVSSASVEFEGLYTYPERRRRTVFERVGRDVSFRRGVAGLPATRELVTPTTLALSAAMRLEVPEISGFARQLANVHVLGLRRRSRGMTYGALAHSTHRLFMTYADRTDPAQPSLLEEDQLRSFGDYRSAVDLLRLADLGIAGIEFADDLDPSIGETRRRVRMLHNTAGFPKALELADESEGTQTWFRLIGPTLAALRLGRVLLLDEIDASLHPRLSARLLELFTDPKTNPRGAQLVFTSHDTSLLGNMNRDEVWLTEKDAFGATTLTALAEYGGDKVRRSLNLERAYLQGRFGAVPDVDQYVIRKALGAETGGGRE
jgi:predicted ATPase